MAALIDLCNRALAAIAKGQIASLDEGSLESRECKRFAQPLLNEMADWSDSLAIAQARAPLAELVNDRPSEWLHRYAVPSDMAQPLAIREVGEAAQYLPLAGPSNFPLQNATPLAFLNESGSIYTNVTNATLIYTRSTVDAGSLTPLLQKAFCDELSARIAMPLTKEPKLVQTLSIMAEQSKAKALADEENKVERHQIRYVTEAEYARQGYGA